jgi:hypothetical protein
MHIMGLPPLEGRIRNYGLTGQVKAQVLARNNEFPLW